MRYLILGGGLIASELIAKISHGDYLLLSRSVAGGSGAIRHDFEWSARFPDAAYEFSPDVVINTVWSEVGNYTDENNSRNHNIQKKIIQALCVFGEQKRIINMGSCWEFANSGSNNVVLSKQQQNFVETKLTVKNEFSHVFGDLSIWAIVYYVYAKNAKKGLLKYVMESIANGQDICLERPNMFVDYIHVADVTNAILELCTYGGLSEVHLGTGLGYTAKQFIDEVVDIVCLEKRSPHVRFTEGTLKETLIADTAAVSDMKWFRSKLSLSAGLHDCT